MTNAEKFKNTFGMTSSELQGMSYIDCLRWFREEYTEPESIMSAEETASKTNSVRLGIIKHKIDYAVSQGFKCTDVPWCMSAEEKLLLNKLGYGIDGAVIDWRLENLEL